MADIIQFMDATQMTSEVASQGQLVSGMSAAEAATATNATTNALANGSNLYTFTASTAEGASNIINFPNAATAAEAATEYATAGGTVSATGAATASTGAAESVGNFALVKGGTDAAGASTAGVAGILTMSLPTWVAAVAPLAGVAVGAGLYKSNPELWTKISQTLLPWFWKDSETMPVMVDKDGQTYFDSNAINALKKLVENEISSVASTTIPSDNIFSVSSFTTSKKVIDNFFSSSLGDYFISDTGVFFRKGRNLYCASNKFPFSYTKYDVSAGTSSTHINDKLGSFSDWKVETYTYNKQIVYITIVSFTSVNFSDCEKVYSPLKDSSSDTYKSAWLAVFGGYSSLPSGLSNWTGNTYPSEVTNPMQVQTGEDENKNPIYTPYYPVSIPIGDPGVTNDPATNPDPVTNPDKKVINPYISPIPDPDKIPEEVPTPSPAPLPNPVPSPQPVPDPSTDPSQDPNDGDVPNDPTPPKDPTDTGNTPTPTIPIIPILPSAATGLLHVYNPTQTQIDQFGSWLWTTFSGDLIDTLSKLFNDPMDAVIGLHELYATPATSGDTTIKAGYLDSGVSSKLVGSRYTTINCGSVVVEEYYQNYLDYSPYTQCYIYLPFIGIVTVSADDIIGNAVNIVYHIDSYTGCCIAVITVAKKGYSSTVYQFEGNCAVEIPITSGYQSTLMAGLLGVAGSAVSGSTAVGLHAAHIGKAGLGKNSVQHSGSFGASYGAMGVKIPYIIVKRPTQKIVTNYSVSYGYPAHKMVYVGNCTGYLRAKEVRVTSTTATNIEKEMIVSALKAGVYVK